MADLDLCNAALLLLGEPAMQSEGTATNKAQRAAVAAADQVRQEFLQKQRWTQSLKQGTVNNDPDATPPLGYAYVGVLPDDFLAMWDANADLYTQLAERKIAWGGASAVLTISYAADVAFALLDPLMKHALATRLCARICKAVTDRVSDLETYRRLAVQAEMDCAARDALNRREAPLLSSNWLPDESCERRPPWMGS